MLVALLSFFLDATPHPSKRQIAVTVIVSIWAIRLSAFLFYRVLVFKSDSRFDGTRENPIKFFIFWLLQMIWVWVVSLPVIYLNASNCTTSLQTTDFVGIVLASIGFLIETSADISKLLHK